MVPLILHSVTIRSLLLLREKDPPVLTFLNLYVTLASRMVTLGS